MQVYRSFQAAQIGFDIPAQFVKRQNPLWLHIQRCEEEQHLILAGWIPAGDHPALHTCPLRQIGMRRTIPPTGLPPHLAASSRTQTVAQHLLRTRGSQTKDQRALSLLHRMGICEYSEVAVG